MPSYGYFYLIGVYVMICVMFKLIDFRILILKAKVLMKHMVHGCFYISVCTELVMNSKAAFFDLNNFSSILLDYYRRREKAKIGKLK